MALINIKFMSETLGRNMEFLAVVPQKSTNGEIGIGSASQQEKYKTVVVLHGLSDDFSIWERRTSIERYAAERGVAVIMPDGERGFYTDMKYGDKYFTFISKELLRVAREFLPLSVKREDTFILGNSMGGYGALKIALKNADTFSAAAGLSSVADIRAFMKVYAPDLKTNIFGEGEISEEECLFAIAKKQDNSLQKPRIYMGVGKGDFMYEDNLRLRDCFQALSYDFTYEESEGDHNWQFWDTYVQRALDWMLK